MTTSSRPNRPSAEAAAAEPLVPVVLVAQAADSDDPGWGGRLGLDLRPEPLHMYVERLGVPDVVRAPDAVDERLAGEHPAGIGEQDFEQLELFQWQSHDLASDGHLVSFGI